MKSVTASFYVDIFTKQKHQLAAMPNRCFYLCKSMIKENFYKTKEWVRKRREILKRDHYECQHCKAQGKYSRGVIVHHIKHLKHRPDLALVDNNLITVCPTCHERLHPERRKSPKEKKRKYAEERW